MLLVSPTEVSRLQQSIAALDLVGGLIDIHEMALARC